MKLLFICSHSYGKVSGGGSQCTNRNYSSLCEILGENNVDTIELKTKVIWSLRAIVARCISYFLGFNAGLSKEIVKEVLERSVNYDVIFIDSSTYGILSRHLRRNNYDGKIIAFFHNVEYAVHKEVVKTNCLKAWKSYIIYNNEKSALMYADEIIALHNKDLTGLSKVYPQVKIPKSTIIPISFKDKCSELLFNTQHTIKNIRPTLLFVGDDWYANIHGIKWFIENVLPYVNVKLKIAGKVSGKLKNMYKNHDIDFLGFVPDLSTVMIESDFIIAPIFKGGGMKVKICEALMYGKNIIGTKEAFIGYEIGTDKVGAICDTQLDFVNALNNYQTLRTEKFNECSRNVFLAKYSFEATLSKFENIILK